MQPLKCEYCQTGNFKTDGEALICSQCGAPLPDVSVVPSAQLFALKVNRVVTHEMREHIYESWKQVFEGTKVPRLIVLEPGVDLVPMKLE